MQNKQGGREEGCACPPQDFLLGATGLVSERHGQTRGLTSVKVFLQELWGTGNPNTTVETEQSLPSRQRGGLHCSHRAVPALVSCHLPEAGFSSGASTALTGTSDSTGWWLQSHQAAAFSVTHSAQPCCSPGAGGRLKGNCSTCGNLPGHCPARVAAGVVLHIPGVWKKALSPLSGSRAQEVLGH